MPNEFSKALASRLGSPHPAPKSTQPTPSEAEVAPVRTPQGDARRRVDPEAAFRVWSAMGSGARSYAAVARHFDVADSTILRLARRGSWDKRLAMIEAPVRDEADEQLRVAVREMNDHHIKVAQDLVRKGADALCYLEPSSVPEALRLIEVGSKLERQAMGEPESRKTLTIETILRERFEALVSYDEPRSIDAEVRPRRQVTIDVPSLDDDDEGGDE